MMRYRQSAFEAEGMWLPSPWQKSSGNANLSSLLEFVLLQPLPLSPIILGTRQRVRRGPSSFVDQVPSLDHRHEVILNLVMPVSTKFAIIVHFRLHYLKKASILQGCHVCDDTAYNLGVYVTVSKLSRDTT
jgi:hypothetical protein